MSDINRHRVVVLVFAIVCIVSLVTSTNVLKLPKGSYSFDLEVKSRGSPDMKYNSAGVLKVSDTISFAHIISEQKSNNDIYEFNSASITRGQLLTYINANKKDSTCYYLSTYSPFSLDAVNSFIQNLEPLHLEEAKEKSFDKEINRLLAEEPDNKFFIGKATLENEQHLVLVVDILGAPKYIIGQHLYITISNFGLDTTEVQDKLMSTSKDLKNKCISLDKEIDSVLPAEKQGMKRRSLEEKQDVEAQPWFYQTDSCDLHYIEDKVACSKLLRTQEVTPQKACVFLHGAGVFEEDVPMNAYVDYWGNIKEFTTQCSEHWFIKRDTKNNGWDARHLQKAFCDLAAYRNQTVESGSEPAIVKDTIVFTHSMGNLIFAAALANNYCQLDASSSWYSINPPFKGSKASLMVQEVCRAYHNKTAPISLEKLYGFIAVEGGYCDHNGDVFGAYKVLGPGYCNEKGECMDHLEQVVKKHVKGALCGLSPVGLLSQYSVLLDALATVVGFGENNDGMVGESSCKGYHPDQFTEDFNSNYYETPLNHADGTCRNGDAIFSTKKKPCSYYSNKY